MSKDPHEQIVDSLLSDVLNDQVPPDQQDAILRRLKEQHESQPVAVALRDTAVVTRETTVRHQSVRRPFQTRPLQTVLVAAVAFACLASLTYIVINLSNRYKKDDSQQTAIEQSTLPGRVDGDSQQERVAVDTDTSGETDLKNDDAGQEALPGRQMADSAQAGPAKTESDEAANQIKLAASDANTEAPQAPAASQVDTKISVDAQMVSLIDDRLTMIWNANDIQTSRTVNDDVWCNRVMQAVANRDATPAERKSLPRKSQLARRQKFVESLLKNEDVLDAFANKWSRSLASTFLGTPIGSEYQRTKDYPAIGHLLAYLRYAIYHNLPYDRLVEDLLTAEGSIEPLDAAYNGAAGFLIAINNRRLDISSRGEPKSFSVATVASRLERGMLGHRSQCALCHDDSGAEFRQESLFARSGLLRDYRVQTGSVTRLVSRPLPKDPVFYEAPDGRLVAAAAETTSQDDADNISPRRRFAKQLISSDAFAKHAVNFVWRELLGHGLARPINDSGSHNPALDPELLDQLAGDFVKEKYNLRSLIGAVLLSEAFARPAEKSGAEKDAGMLFASFQPALSNTGGSPPTSQQTLKKLASVYIKSGETSATNSMSARKAIFEGDGSSIGSIASGVKERMLAASGWGTSDASSKMLDSLVASAMTDEQKVEHLFLLSLVRQPTKQESESCQQMLESKSGNATAIFQDIWWAISTY